MKYLLIILFNIVLTAPLVEAQQKPGAQATSSVQRERFKDRLLYGGVLGLQFGTLTLIDVAPMVGYKLTPSIETGVGLTYKYYRYRDFYYNQYTNQRFDLESHIFGASIYSRFHILNPLFAHVEFERLMYNHDEIYFQGTQMLREPKQTYINGLLVGAGLKQRISDRSYFYILALWDLVQDEMSPYSNPLIRMGVMLGM
jgi:hypothetical protein